MFHGKIPGAPIPANKGSQVPSHPSPSSIAGFALTETKNSGEHGTLSIADEALATHAALSFFPPSHRANLIRSQLKVLIPDTARFIAVTISVIPSATYNGGHGCIDSVTTAVVNHIQKNTVEAIAVRTIQSGCLTLNCAVLFKEPRNRNKTQ